MFIPTLALADQFTCLSMLVFDGMCEQLFAFGKVIIPEGLLDNLANEENQ